jgi:glycosyltransferase involved in cell wall biosynthesis
MRLLQIDTGRLWRGGQRQCALLCRNLAAGGAEVHLTCRHGAPLSQEFAGTPVRLHALRVGGELNPIAALLIARRIRETHPELIAAHEAHGLGLAILARALAGARVPLVYHRRVDAPLGAGLASRWKLRAPGLYICVSGAVAAVVARAGIAAERIRIVTDGVRPIERVPGAPASVRAELGLDRDALIIGTIGSLTGHKDHATLIAAFARVVAGMPRAHLVVVGSGCLQECLRQQAAALSIAPSTHFLGERRDTGRLLSAMDLFVLPSRTEGLGSTILDAFSLEVPVVATRAGGIPDLVEDGGTGRLADVGHPEALAATITRVFEDPAASRAMAVRARARFLAQFTDRAMTDRTVACYRELLSTGAGNG